MQRFAKEIIERREQIWPDFERPLSHFLTNAYPLLPSTPSRNPIDVFHGFRMLVDHLESREVDKRGVVTKHPEPTENSAVLSHALGVYTLDNALLTVFPNNPDLRRSVYHAVSIRHLPGDISEDVRKGLRGVSRDDVCKLFDAYNGFRASVVAASLKMLAKEFPLKLTNDELDSVSSKITNPDLPELLSSLKKKHVPKNFSDEKLAKLAPLVVRIYSAASSQTPEGKAHAKTLKLLLEHYDKSSASYPDRILRLTNEINLTIKTVK